MCPTKRFGYIIILGIIVSITIPTVNSQIEKDFLENLKKSLLQKPLNIFNATQSRNYNEQLCVQQLEAVLNAMGKFQLWSLRMADAWGKMPSGILSGNFYELGNFDQCLEIEKSVAEAGTIKGQYCLAGLILQLNRSELGENDFFPGHLKTQFAPDDDTLKQSSSENITIQFNIGICTPSTCSPDFLRDIIENEIETKINFSIAVSLIEDNCYSNEPIEYNGADIFAIVFFSFVGFLMIVSTIYDVYCIRMDKIRENIFIAFSVYTNGEKLFKCNRSKPINVMDCINGIRSLSVIWVVFAHTYLAFLNSPTSNLLDLPKWLENPYSMVIIGAPVVVDSFLLMSGLLVAWAMLRHLDKTKGKINIPLLYFHRYLRLTPALAANILFYATLWKLLVIGPTSSPNIKVAEFCDSYWWSALLYVQNYVNPSNMCLDLSWYLSVDMQCFILSPLFIYPLWRWKNKFIWIIPVIIFLSIGCVFSLYMINGYINTIDTIVGDEAVLNEIHNKTYFPTHIRIGAWLVGVLLGYFLHNVKDKKINLSSFTVILGWTISLVSILAIVFGIFTMNQQWHKATVLESSFHESLCRVSWAISLSWIIFACVKGYGGPINWFLSLPVWQPISRVSYSLYLVHFAVLVGISASARTTSQMTHFNAIQKFWGNFAISILVAILCSLAFESPILILEKILLGNESKSNKSNSKQNENT